MHKTNYTKAQIKEAMELLVSTKAKEIEAEQNERKRLAALKAIQRRARIRPLSNRSNFDNCDARVKYCPACQPLVDLIVKHVSAVTTRKECSYCKGYFEYTRTDTPEGRAQRAIENKLVRQKSPIEIFEQGIVE